LPEDLHAENIGDYFFCFSIKVWVDESYVIVAGNAVAQCGKAFVDALDDDLVGEGITDVHEFLVCH
jgi:hypothetical protein